MNLKTILFLSITNQCPVGCECDDRTPEQKIFLDGKLKEFNGGMKLKPKTSKGSAVYLNPRKH